MYVASVDASQYFAHSGLNTMTAVLQTTCSNTFPWTIFQILVTTINEIYSCWSSKWHVQLMTWCCQATSHNLKRYWPRFMTSRNESDFARSVVVTCQNLHFGKYVRLSVCYLPKFSIFASMFVCRFVCLSVRFVKHNSWTLWHIITKLGPHMEWMSSSSMWHWQISRSWN